MKQSPSALPTVGFRRALIHDKYDYFMIKASYTAAIFVYSIAHQELQYKICMYVERLNVWKLLNNQWPMKITFCSFMPHVDPGTILRLHE